MGYALIWIEGMAAALALVAATTASDAGKARSWIRMIAFAVVICLFFIPAALVTFVACELYLPAVNGPKTWISYTSSWLIVFIVGTLILLFAGSRRRGALGERAAQAWSPGKLLLAAAAFLIVQCITFLNMDLAAQTQMASLRANAGAALASVAPARVPDHENAAIIYQEAFEAMQTTENMAWAEKNWKSLERWFELKAEINLTDKDMMAYLARQKHAIALLQKAARRPGCYFEHEYEQAIAIRLPEVQRLREGANVLSLDARVHAAQGHRQAAWEDVAAIFGMARHVNDPPILISLLVSVAIESVGARTVEQILASVPPQREDLEKIPLENIPSNRKKFQRAIRGEETIFGIYVFTMPPDFPELERLAAGVEQIPGQNHSLFVTALEPFWRVFLASDDLDTYREIMRKSYNLAEQPYYKSRAEWSELDMPIRDNRYAILSRILLPAAGKCAAAAARGDATRQLTRLAFAAASYRAKTGKYPTKQEDLVPAYIPQIPIDPFDGKPLRMKPGGKGLVLYSIGPDLKDDGGRPWAEGGPDGDIVFRLK